MRPLQQPPLQHRVALTLLCVVVFTLFAACGGSGVAARTDDGGPPLPPVVITTTQVPAAFRNLPFSFRLQAEGGHADYAWTQEPGTTLPTGMSLDGTGVLRGTPRATGTFSLRVRVTDRQDPAATATATFDLVVGTGIDDLRAEPGPDRGTVVLRFTAPPAEGGPVTAYEVRASVRHIGTEADLVLATPVPHTHAPGAPGTLEVLTLTGLEPGQTLQLAVRPVRGGVPGPFAYAVASRVGVGAGEPRPANAVTISSPGTLATPGTYYLDRDVSAAGTAFTITSADVVLDLGGHTVTYGTGAGEAHGVAADGVQGTVTLRNGRIVQGGGGGTACHGVSLVAIDTLDVSGVEVTVTGVDADGFSIWTVPQHLRIRHCIANCRTQKVTDRHFPGVAAIRADDVLGSAEIDHNLVNGSPQWGLRLQGHASTGDVLVHHNIVRGTKALVPNGYMIGIYKRNADVFENDLIGESRGIHVASSGEDASDCRVHDNVMWVQDQPNEEYPVQHWVHGIKIEGAPGSKVYDNVVTGVADDEHAEVRGIDVGLQNEVDQDLHGVEVVRNRVKALAATARWPGHAIMWSEGTAGPTNDIVVRHNVLTATDRIFLHDWGGGRGALVRDNVLVRDLGLGAAHEFYVEEFGNGGTPNPGNRLLDNHTAIDLYHLYEYHEAKSYDATREWTLTLLVRGAGGVPIAGAVATVTDAKGAQVIQTQTDAAGFARGTVVEATITKGLVVDRHGPFTVAVSKTGVGAYHGVMSIAARTGLIVDLPAGTATPDTTAPGAPEVFLATPVSASRVLLRWSASPDDTGVVAWLVQVDDEVVGITDDLRFTVPGLAPDRSHTFALRAVDAAGNVSAPSTATATTRPEDRGPVR